MIQCSPLCLRCLATRDLFSGKPASFTGGSRRTLATILNGSMFKQGLDNAFASQTDPSYRFDGAAIVDE
jgi:hypothetical protein